MDKILIPVDDRSEARTRHAVAEAVAIYRLAPVDIHLLNVQPLVSGHVAMFFLGGSLRQMQLDAGEQVLGVARALFEAAGVPCQGTVVIGHSAESIARRAQELGCGRIVMGYDDSRRLADRVLGGLAPQVRHLIGASGTCQVLGS